MFYPWSYWKPHWNRKILSRCNNLCMLHKLSFEHHPFFEWLSRLLHFQNTKLCGCRSVTYINEHVFVHLLDRDGVKKNIQRPYIQSDKPNGVFLQINLWEEIWNEHTQENDRIRASVITSHNSILGSMSPCMKPLHTFEIQTTKIFIDLRCFFFFGQFSTFEWLGHYTDIMRLFQKKMNETHVLDAYRPTQTPNDRIHFWHFDDDEPKKSRYIRAFVKKQENSSAQIACLNLLQLTRWSTRIFHVVLAHIRWSFESPIDPKKETKQSCT